MPIDMSVLDSVHVERAVRDMLRWLRVLILFVSVPLHLCFVNDQIADGDEEGIRAMSLNSSSIFPAGVPLKFSRSTSLPSFKYSGC